jgi:SNF2 family DNA or RNA helicase
MYHTEGTTTLIIAPLPSLNQWKSEIKKFAVQPKVVFFNLLFQFDSLIFEDTSLHTNQWRHYT